MYRSRTIVIMLIVGAAVVVSACTPPACDLNSDQYDPDRCETVLGNLLDYLTALAYGNPYAPPDPPNPCPVRLVCYLPECHFVHQNGSFEAEQDDEVALWYGDETRQTGVPTCDEEYALEFISTTPDGPSASASSQVYQVIDYERLREGLQDETLQRVRAAVAFGIFLPSEGDDRQFGLRIDAYAGSGFPVGEDLEMIPTQTDSYRRLATAEETLSYDVDGPKWQPLEAEMAVPEATDFLVVALEAVEDVSNDVQSEFSGHAADEVQIAMDGGNVPPKARADQAITGEDIPFSLDVTSNDIDPTSPIDRNSVTITQPPVVGSATVIGDGRVRYVPEPEFVGTTLFTYTVADVEGLVSNEAAVVVEVRAVNDVPVAADDAYAVPDGGLLIVPTGLGVLANDTDADGDTLTAELVQDVDAGSLNLDPSGAFTYTAPTAFSGTASFTYRATDGLVASDPATVTLTRAAASFDLQALVSGSTEPERIGQAFTYTVQVAKQPAEAAVTGIEVAHEVPAGLVYLGHQATTGSYDPTAGRWTFDLPAQTTVGFLSLSARADTAGTWTAAATITGGLDGDTDSSNDHATAQLVAEPRYFLSVTASASPDTVRVGEQVLVDVLVGNGGGNVAEGVVATVELPAGLTFAEASGAGTYDPQTGRWTIGDLAPGPSASLRLTTTAATQGTWTVSAALTEGITYDADPDNNADTVAVTVDP